MCVGRKGGGEERGQILNDHHVADTKISTMLFILVYFIQHFGSKMSDLKNLFRLIENDPPSLKLELV